tara:strand:+ start:268 stop:675 length:408 start_codon:yes stop_codon:yes gene_type:complete
MTKEKAPSTPEEGNDSESILDPFWTTEKVQEMADKWLEELKPLCKTELELKFAEAITKLFARQNQHLEAINLQDRAIGHHQDQLNFLKGGYDDLCGTHDQWKTNIWTITNRQKDFISEVRSIITSIKKRLTKAGL